MSESNCYSCSQGKRVTVTPHPLYGVVTYRITCTVLCTYTYLRPVVAMGSATSYAEQRANNNVYFNVPVNSETAGGEGEI